ncbi:SDR family oxidoreductase, partial [Streptomyces sp. NPDC046862]|uniref:SDR family oxidoreductase n=1 Tax=Streptomyces sp. NPDC046862 TaxID=3154603 RepID=UPI003456FC6B
DSAVEKDVLAAGGSFEAIRTDFADPHAVRALGENLAGRERPVDILVNNAGTIRRAPAAEHSDADWELVLQVNLSAQFALTRAVGAAMVARGRGKIIFTASLLSFQGGITVPGYTAAKHGIAGLTKALANEWAPHGVNVNAIAPGYIATDNTQALQDDPARSKAILERIPAGRWGTADDLAGATVFLASGAADYVHGTVLPVDGGWLGR